MPSLRIQLSVIVPVYNEAPVLHAFFNTLVPALEALGQSYEIIAIDDGSTDGSWELLKEAQAANPHIRLVRLIRCFGKEAAMRAGLKYASGAAAVFMDADLQHPPAVLPSMIAEWKNGAEIVLAQNQHHSKREKSRRLLSLMFVRLFNMGNNRPVPAGTSDFQLIDRKVIDALNQMPERVHFLRGLSAWLGFKAALVPFACPARTAGKSHYNFYIFWQLMLDGFAGFNSMPFTLCTFLGAVLVLLGVVSIFISSGAGPIWLMLLLAGVQLGAIGLVGEYLARVLREVKQRPSYLVGETSGF